MSRPFQPIALCLAAGLAFTAFDVHATAFDRPQTRIVRFSERDLSTEHGVEAVYRRIQIAARAVCGESESPNSLMPLSSWRSCVATAVDSAVASTAQPALIAYHERTARPRGGKTRL
jgi:UrcA family protein